MKRKTATSRQASAAKQQQQQQQLTHGNEFRDNSLTIFANY
jgi:hypothetical protein